MELRLTTTHDRFGKSHLWVRDWAARVLETDGHYDHSFLKLGIFDADIDERALD